ncbi:hypothetical protein VNO80_03643 [Phaseolus coccineus]|uniref:Uncharacterized protein n=1 Tax=Phaseolus coccineus TaxID=3886 RepID=A0AAN9NTJ6_PHACN
MFLSFSREIMEQPNWIHVFDVFLLFTSSLLRNTKSYSPCHLNTIHKLTSFTTTGLILNSWYCNAKQSKEGKVINE